MRILSLTIALAACAAVAASGPALAAKKKMTYEQAFAACKTQVDAKMPKTDKNDVQRSTAGAACMKKAGFKLKNPSEF